VVSFVTVWSSVQHNSAVHQLESARVAAVGDPPLDRPGFGQ